MKWTGVLVSLGWMAGAGIASAGSLAADGIGLPLQCDFGKTCWVANYVDVDKTTGVKDFRCRGRSYDGHDGTDFAIRDMSVMAGGVQVLAVANGLVRNARDGMEDVAFAEDAASRTRIKNRECGNGVLLAHEEGWETQYCHLRRGSITVKQGDSVQRGQQLGLVGLSGKTQFPHVHLTVRAKGQVIDPFTGRPTSEGCGKEEKPLWLAGLNTAYEELALYNVGFAGEAPNMDAIRQGNRTDGPFKPTSAALVLWVDAFGIEAGDVLQFRITGPDGKLVWEQKKVMEKPQARTFAYVGKKLTRGEWPSGIYNGKVTLTRMRDAKPIRSEIGSSVTVR